MSILIPILQVFLGIMFLILGLLSLIGLKQKKQNFNHLRVPSFFRIVTGIVQLIGGIGSFIGISSPFIAVLANIWIIMMMIVALVLHFRIKEHFAKKVPALIVCFSSLMILIFH